MMSDSKVGLTSSQTIGPFFKYGLAWQDGEQAFPEGATGTAIEISGTLVDGAGKPISDAMIEFWQADATGNFGGPTQGSCAGFARAYTNPQGGFVLRTRKPGPVAGADGKLQAPHILVCLFSRGMLKHLFTHIYFGDEPANGQDPVLRAAGARAETLIARPAGAGKYAWDMVLQGERETVFLDL